MEAALRALEQAMRGRPTADRRRPWRLVLAALISTLLLLPVCLGLAGVLLPSFGYMPAIGGESLSLQPWRQLWDEPGIWTASLLGLFSGLASAFLSFVLVMLLLAGGRTWIRRLLERLLAPLVAVPHIALAVGLVFLLMPSGWLVRLVSPWPSGWQRPPVYAFPNDSDALALILGLIIKETPFLLLVALAALPQVKELQRLRMARSLGYHPATAWLKAVLPDLARRLRLPLFAVVAYGVSNVEMAIVLGPGAPPTLAVMILQWFQDPDLTRRFLGSAAAVLQLGLVGLALLLWQAGARAGWATWHCLASDGRRRTGKFAVQCGLYGGHSILVLLSLLSLASLLVWSLSAAWRFPAAWPQWGIATWMRHGDGLWQITATTILLAAGSSVLALLLSLAALESESGRKGRPGGRGALVILSAPLVVPQIAFLFGTAVLAAQAGLIGGWPVLLWGHLLFVLPYVYLALAGPFRGLDPRYAAMAASLGKGRLAVFFRVTLPLLRRPVLTAAAIGVAVSVALYLPTVLLGGGRFTTLASEAVTLSSGGDRRLLAVTALLQAALPLLALWLAAVAGRTRMAKP